MIFKTIRRFKTKSKLLVMDFYMDASRLPRFLRALLDRLGCSSISGLVAVDNFLLAPFQANIGKNVTASGSAA
jgi:hypothetical protein